MKEFFGSVFFTSEGRLNKGLVAMIAFSAIVIAIGVYNLSGPIDPSKSLLTVTGTNPRATRLVKDAKPDNLILRFNGSAAALELVGKTLSEGISISPAIAGEWRWVDDTRLIFTPAVDWDVGKGYTVSMGKSIFAEHVVLKDYDYEFRTEPFSMSVKDSEFYQDPINPREKKVVVTLKFNYPVDPATLRDRVKVKFMADEALLTGDKKTDYMFNVTYDEFRGEAYIHSEPVSLPLDDAQMKVTVEPGVRSSRGGNPTPAAVMTSIRIPSVYNYFWIKSAGVQLVRNKKYEPEQVLVVENNAGVLESVMNEAVSAYILPKDRPAAAGRPRQTNHYWSNPEEVGPEVLALSQKVQLQPIPADREYATVHSYRLDVDPGKYLYVKVNKGIKSFGDYILAKEYNRIIRVPEYPKELEIMHDGALLSLGGEKTISVLARGIEAIRYDISRVLPDKISHLVSQSYGSFKDPYFNYNFGPDHISERFTETKRLKPLPPNKTQYSSLDFSGYLNPKGGYGARRGLFFMEARSWDPDFDRPTGKSDKRLILVTDLGLLVKDNADDTHDVFVMSIESGTPVAGAKVEVLGLNGLPVVTRTTGVDGHVSIPSLKGFEREQKPVAYLARKGFDVSFIPYDMEDRRLNISRFDTGGVRTEGKGERLGAYLFSDRGIYRPGDEFKVGMIVRSADWEMDISGIPLEVTIHDPRGLQVMKRSIRLGTVGFEETSYKTEESSPTGNYDVRLYVIKDNNIRLLLGSTSVKVEEFLPDRMKIRTSFSAPPGKGWVSPDGLKGLVTLTNLYGTPATGRKVRGSIELRPSGIYFPEFRDYTFGDPMKAEKSFSDRLKDAVTDDSGEAEFDLNLGRYDKGTYRLTFEAEGFEADGGRSVSSVSGALVSPLEYMVGYKPDGGLRYIKKKSSRSVELVAVTPDPARRAADGLTARLYERKYVSVLKKQDNGTFKYESEMKETAIGDEKIKIPVEGLKYALNTSEPGEYALSVIDPDGLELAKVPYSVVGEANLTRSLEKNSELLVKLDKADYKPGEYIEVSIKAPYIGAGLVTIERDRVYAYKWFRTTTTGSVQKIMVPKDLEAGGYVNVSFVRAMDSDEVFMSPLSYGVEPFSVSLDKRTVKIDIDAQERARPGEPYRIVYSGNHKGKAVVFAVDEGILQVARYSTPDPVSHFFKKRALEVDTFQILDLILPEFSRVMAMSAEGGGDFEDAVGKNLNPFKRKRDKPVAYWSGIVDIDEKDRELVYDVPDYFSGTLRVMAVAVSDTAVGAADMKAIVKGPFVISPNVPTFVSPGDEFTVSANVANEVPGSGEDAKVKLSLKTTKHVTVLDEAVREMTIPEGRELSATFRVKANAVLGSGDFEFTASHGKESGVRKVSLSVRPPSPFMTKLSGGSVKDAKATLDVTRKMYPHYRTLEFSASPIPLAIADGLTRYLKNYPHLCTEQLVSQAMPALVLRDVTNLGYEKQVAENTLHTTMRVLMARQNDEGAFGMWAANSHVVDFHTTYAVQFLTEASESGYPVDREMFQKALSYLKALADKKSVDMYECRTRAHAIYLLTRNGIVTTGNAMDLKGILERNHEDVWQKDLAGAYLAATFKLLKLDKEANAIIRKLKVGEETRDDYNRYYGGLVRDAQLVYLISKHFPDRAEDLTDEDIMFIVNPVLRNRFNTTSAALSILALKAYSDTAGMPGEYELKIKEIAADGKETPIKTEGKAVRTGKFTENAAKIKIDSDSEFTLFYQMTEAGYDTALPTEAMKDGLEVFREYRNERGDVVTSAKLGDTLDVVLRVRTNNKETVDNVALVDLLPGGFEPVLDRSAVIASDHFSSHDYWQADYFDIREDRVVVYGTANQSIREFRYQIKATNRGAYNIPPAYGEAMYDPSILGRSTGGSFVVE